MNKQITFLMITYVLIISCNKQNTDMEYASGKPVTFFVSAEATLLDTAAFPGKRYMHFKIMFDIITGDRDIFFKDFPSNNRAILAVLGADTIHEHTVFPPVILTDIPEVIPETGVYKILAGDTIQAAYFVMVIAHGPWTDFYLQAYTFPYSLGVDDGTYESSIVFNDSYVTQRP